MQEYDERLEYVICECYSTAYVCMNAIYLLIEIVGKETDHYLRYVDKFNCRNILLRNISDIQKR